MSTPKQASDVRDRIVATNARFVAAFANKDGAAISACYTEQAQVLPPNSEPITGRKAIGEFWMTVRNSGIAAATVDAVEVESHGQEAHEIGRYTLLDAAGKELDRGKYLVVWKQEDGAWKLYRDIWNSSKPR